MRTARLDLDVVQWREIDGEVLIVDTRTSRCIAANESASLLWPLLARGATSDELADALAARWQLPEERARADVDALVRSLDDAGLLTDEGV